MHSRLCIHKESKVVNFGQSKLSAFWKIESIQQLETKNQIILIKNKPQIEYKKASNIQKLHYVFPESPKNNVGLINLHGKYKISVAPPPGLPFSIREEMWKKQI